MSKPFKSLTSGGTLVRRDVLESALNQQSQKTLKALDAMWRELDGRLRALEKLKPDWQHPEAVSTHYDITPEGREALDAVPTDAEGPEAA